MYVVSNQVTLYTGAQLYGIHRTCTETAAVSHDTSLVNGNSTALYPLEWIFKNALCKSISFTETSTTTRAQWICSVAANSDIVALVKPRAHVEMKRSKTVAINKSEQALWSP